MLPHPVSFFMAFQRKGLAVFGGNIIWAAQRPVDQIAFEFSG
jgi:hypothetical protein